MAALLAALVCALSTAVLFAPQAKAPGRSSSDSLERGERLYARSCASCHGPSGEGGKGPALAVPNLSRAADRETLTTIIRRGLEGTEMPGTRFTNDELKAVSDWVVGLGRRPREQSSGNAVRGAQLYLTKGGCASCHTIKGQGGAFGPDLTDIGRRRGAAHLRQSLLDPDADVFKGSSIYRNNVSITENFLLVRVTTLDGRQLQGVRVNEDTFSIQFRDGAGGLHSFFKSELGELRKEWGRSPMPPYGQVLSTGELEDVVSYMLSLRGA
jgi:cytochrome c oxidase cbb3-type subunit 3